MGTINKVTLKGQLGKEPSWGALPNGALACRLVLATTVIDEDEATGKAQRSTEWHRAVLEGRLAEQVRDGLAKGDEVYVEGRLKTRKWTDRHGIARYCTEILADAVQVFPKARPRVATITDDELIAWVSAYDEATAREAAAEAAKAVVLRLHRATTKVDARHKACH